MLKWIFISITVLLVTSLLAVYFHVSVKIFKTSRKKLKSNLQYRNKHANNPLDELKKGLGNGTIDKAKYFDVQNDLTLHKEEMARNGKFFNDDGHVITIPESITEETESEVTNETDVSDENQKNPPKQEIKK